MAAGQHRACNCRSGCRDVFCGCRSRRTLRLAGKRRTLANPKRKNKKHVQQTATVIALTSWTDKRLRTWLNEFAAAQ